MVKVTRVNGDVFYVNEKLIEFLEETPDTVIALESGKMIKVLESIDTLLERIVENEVKIRNFHSGANSDGFISQSNERKA